MTKRNSSDISGDYVVNWQPIDYGPQTATRPAIDMQVFIDECCLLQRLRQLRNGVLHSWEIRVIIDVTSEGIVWWVSEKKEGASNDWKEKM